MERTRAALERRLAAVRGFDHPRIDLEQYPTPPHIAASIIHTADLRDDITNRLVVDLGCGTGMLAIAAALRRPAACVALDIDRSALDTGIRNARQVGPPIPIEWVLGDVLTNPLSTTDATVLMNPPFGAQRDNVHADRAFLTVARDLARVSYSIHNAGSEEFIRSFASDNEGVVTDGWALKFDLANQFEFHSADSTTIDAEAFRIEWSTW